ncbi:MAG: nucleotidyltransferase domain-containing protein [Lachnospiraceae bacterium]|nr:nucleotidyltransferase domain-containing protein [Lachnospiraceae bacterium]
MTELKRKRLQRKITQREAAERMGVSLRTYITYENDASKERTMKYRYFLLEIEAMDRIDEEHGVLTIEEIRDLSRSIFEQYAVESAILFGSYAKGTATATSDVDIVVVSEVTGLRFFGLTESLREALKKRVDILDQRQLVGNEELLRDVLKDGVRIYGK